MIASTPEQKRKIAAMMTGRRLALRNPGPRHFPKYVGQSTREYVRVYEHMNRCCQHARPFQVEDLQPPVGYDRNQGK